MTQRLWTGSVRLRRMSVAGIVRRIRSQASLVMKNRIISAEAFGPLLSV